MSAFQSSTSLQQHQPTSSQNVISTTSKLLSTTKTTGGGGGSGTTTSSGGGIESHPKLGKWYIRNYGLGPRQQVKFLTGKSLLENRYTSIKFRTDSGLASINHLNFSNNNNSGTSNSTSTTNRGALVVASGPRVSLYGGINRTIGTSAFSRALKGGSIVQRRKAKLIDDDDEEFDNDDDDDDDESVDLFGGKTKNQQQGSTTKSKKKVEDGLDDISSDRNISTGGLQASCASHRSDSKLIAIGTEGGTIRICDANSRATLRTFNSTKSGGGGGTDRKTIRSIAWLRNGKHIVAGGDDGLVRVWNVSGGMKDGGIGSGGGAEISLRGHSDKVSCIQVVTYRKDEYDAVQKKKEKSKKRKNITSTASAIMEDDTSSPTWSQLVVSGSFDHTIRVWDIESTDGPRGEDRCVSIMNHGDPIQALLVMPPLGYYNSRSSIKKARKLDNIPLLVSAGGTTLKVWNTFNGSCLGTFQTLHAKTIMSLCLLDIPRDFNDEEDGDNDDGGMMMKRHIITGGLDGLLRIHSASNDDIVSGSFPYVHGMQITEPISALAISNDMSRIAIGTTTGIVMIHQRRRLISAAKKAQEEELRRREPRHGTYAYFTRGAHEKSHDPEDYLLLHQKKQKLAEYDLLLRKFRYGDALDAVLAKRQPKAVIAVIEELGKRRGLTIALSNRDEESLDAILSFTIRFIDNPQYTPHLIGVAHILIDIYGSLKSQSVVVDELFDKLRDKIANECAAQKVILRMLGQMDYVMTAAEMFNVEKRK